MMEDFSRFGSPSPQWIKYLESAPAASSAPGSVKELQNVTNSLRDQTSAAAMITLGLHKAVSCTDVLIPTRDGQTTPARTYRPGHLPTTTKLPVFIHFHGGGFLFGTLSSEDVACARISNALQICVVNVCYRHTPQFKFPTQQNDAWDSFEWLSRAENMTSIGGDDQAVVVGGISAGASLAAWVVQQCQLPNGPNSIKVRGQVLGIPWLLHPDAYPAELLSLGSNSSAEQHRDAPVLPKSRVDLFVNLLEIADPYDPRFNPGLAGDDTLRTLPKTALLVAGMDPLRDEALYYANQLARNGIPLKVHIFPGLPHGFRRFDIPASNLWDKTIQESITWTLNNNELVRRDTVPHLHVEDTC